MGIITVSDRASKGEYEDKSGPVIKELVEAAGMEVVDYIIVPDEKGQIAKKLLYFSDQRQVDLVFTTGGTGFSKRDVTPEATKAGCGKRSTRYRRGAQSLFSYNHTEGYVKSPNCRYKRKYSDNKFTGQSEGL